MCGVNGDVKVVTRAARDQLNRANCCLNSDLKGSLGESLHLCRNYLWGADEPIPPVPGALSALRAEPRIGEGQPLVPH